MTNPVNYKHTPVRIVLDSTIMCRFDYPQVAGEPFLFSIPKSFSGNEWAVLKQVLNGREGRTQLVRSPVDMDLAAFKVYDISNYIPQFVRDRLGKDREVPGPNCYQAALASAGFSELEGRYVDPLEAGFYFTRYFEKSRAKPQLGDLRVYYRGHMTPTAAMGFTPAEVPEPALIDIMKRAYDIPAAVGSTNVHMFDLEDVPEWMGTIFDAVPDISDRGLDAVTAITAMAPAAEVEAIDTRAELEILEAGVEEAEAELEEVMERARAAGVELAESAAAEEEAEDVPDVAAEYVPEIKHGVHAAVVLLGGTVFQRGGWHDDHTNMVVPAAVAMSSIEPISDDPFYPAERADDADYTSRVIRRLSSSALMKRMSGRMIDHELTASVEKYLLLLDYYSKRMQAVGDAKGTFSKNRLNLLTMENVWNILSKLEEKLRSSDLGMTRSLLRMREDVVQEFLKFRSLKWQYSAMVQRYGAPSRTAGRSKKIRYMQDLYRENYVDPDSKEFAQEINAHLRMKGIAYQRFPAIRAYVIERVKQQATEAHLLDYAKSNGSRGIDFFKILEEAIQELSSRGGR